MNELEYPKYFYKYRSVGKAEKLSDDRSLQALFKCESILSSRTVFNDLFDSKIHFIMPSVQDIEELIAKSHVTDKVFYEKFISSGKFTSQGIEFLDSAAKKANAIIDRYHFLSLSTNPQSNLMWAHYASDHGGFCIEFKSENLHADRVTYQAEIPEIPLIKILSINHPGGADVGQIIWRALRTKLLEWAYEDEYRFQPAKMMYDHMVQIDSAHVKLAYAPEWVESIIFGYRMPHTTREFISQNLPFKAKFKEVIALRSKIEIVDATGY